MPFLNIDNLNCKLQCNFLSNWDGVNGDSVNNMANNIYEPGNQFIRTLFSYYSHKLLNVINEKLPKINRSFLLERRKGHDNLKGGMEMRSN